MAFISLIASQACSLKGQWKDLDAVPATIPTVSYRSFIQFCIITIRLRVMQHMVLTFCPSVHLSNMCVRLSNAWIVTTIRVIGGGDPIYLKFWAKLTLLEWKHWFSIDICS